MVTFDDNNPKFPKCNQPCSNSYRCKYCNCNMHCFCSTDGSDGSLLGHGAQYVCVSCSKKKQRSTVKDAASNMVRRLQNSGNTSSNEEAAAVNRGKRSQNSGKASSTVRSATTRKQNKLRSSDNTSSILGGGNANGEKSSRKC